jgi:hypothetical protein
MADLSRSASRLCRHRRLRDVRRCHPHGVRPCSLDPDCRCGGLLLAIPTAFFAFRLQGAYFAIGTWVIAEVVRLLVAQWQAVGGGTGTSLPRSATGDMWLDRKPIETLFDVRNAAARDILAYWLAVLLAVATIAGIYWLLRTKRGLGSGGGARQHRSGEIRRRRCRPHEMDRVPGLGLRHRPRRRTDLHAEGADLTGRGILVQDWTAYVIFIVVIGGIGTIEGPILGVLVFFILQSLLADYGSWYLMIARHHRHRHHAVCPARPLGPVFRPHRHRTVSRAPAPDRRAPRQLTIIIRRRNREWLIFKPTF